MKLPVLTKAQIITYSLIGFAIVVIIILIISKFSSLKSLILDNKRNQDLIDEANQTINTEDITITQDQFSTYAGKLYKAFKGWGTDEDAVYAVFKEMNSRSDVQQLIKTFGIKDSKTLTEWMYDELSQTDIEHINAILASKSINYKF